MCSNLALVSFRCESEIHVLCDLAWLASLLPFYTVGGGSHVRARGEREREHEGGSNARKKEKEACGFRQAARG